MMFIHTWERVLDRSKSQTRRIRFPYNLAVQLWKYGWALPWNYAWSSDQQQALIKPRHIRSANAFLKKYYITLPIIPGRRKKSVGRIHITGIRREQLQAISKEDVFAEGIGIEVDGRLYPITVPDVAIEHFVRLWDNINAKRGIHWHDAPEVFVFSLELVSKDV